MEGGSFLHWIPTLIFPTLRAAHLFSQQPWEVFVRISFYFLNKEKAQREKKRGKEETD